MSNKITSIKKLTEIIVDAIREEQMFSKEVLIPKIRALISAFRLNMDAHAYNSIEKPNETQRLIRSNQLHNLEKDFWKQELKKQVGESNMQFYYNKLDEERLKWNGAKTLTEELN